MSCPLGCAHDCTHDAVVHPAAAQIGFKGCAHLVFGGVGVAIKQRLRGQDHARGAVPALCGLFIDEGLLQAGGFAVALTGAAVGAAISTNDIADTVRARIEGLNVTAKGVSVTSNEGSYIVNLTVAGAGAEGWAAGGPAALSEGARTRQHVHSPGGC